jgi:hypothetical protein
MSFHPLSGSIGNNASKGGVKDWLTIKRLRTEPGEPEQDAQRLQDATANTDPEAEMKKAAGFRQRPLDPKTGTDYVRLAPMVFSVVLRLLPMVEAPAMMATEMRAAIRPYSIAVAPDSFLTKRATSFMVMLLGSTCFYTLGDQVVPDLTIAIYKGRVENRLILIANKT